MSPVCTCLHLSPFCTYLHVSPICTYLLVSYICTYLHVSPICTYLHVSPICTYLLVSYICTYLHVLPICTYLHMSPVCTYCVFVNAVVCCQVHYSSKMNHDTPSPDTAYTGLSNPRTPLKKANLYIWLTLQQQLSQVSVSNNYCLRSVSATSIRSLSATASSGQCQQQLSQVKVSNNDIKSMSATIVMSVSAKILGSVLGLTQ